MMAPAPSVSATVVVGTPKMVGLTAGEVMTLVCICAMDARCSVLDLEFVLADAIGSHACY